MSNGEIFRYVQTFHDPWMTQTEREGKGATQIMIGGWLWSRLDAAGALKVWGIQNSATCLDIKYFRETISITPFASASGFAEELATWQVADPTNTRRLLATWKNQVLGLGSLGLHC